MNVLVPVLAIAWLESYHAWEQGCSSLGQEGVLVLLDYTCAFDASSRKFLDSVIGEARARSTLQHFCCRQMVVAVGRVTVNRSDGSAALSDAFDLDVGGIQGGYESRMSRVTIYIYYLIVPSLELPCAIAYAYINRSRVLAF